MIDQHMTKNELRKFGIVTGSIVAILFGLFFPWLFDSEMLPMWPWVVAGILFAWAIIYPESLQVVYTVWMRIGAVLGWVNTRIILGLIYFFLFFPVSLILVVIRKDPMERKFTAQNSYRIKSIKQLKKHMEKPF